MKPQILVAGLLVLATLAGCLDAPRDDPQPVLATAHASDRDPDREPHMTAEASESEDEGFAPGGPLGLTGVYYVERTVTLQGVLDLDHLPVDLLVRNGDVRVVTTNDADAWRAVVTMRGTGVTPADAREHVARMHLDWAYTDGNRYFLDVRVTTEPREQDPYVHAFDGATEDSVTLELPRRVIATMNAESRNGDVVAESPVGDRVVLDSRNGRVLVENPLAESLAASSRNGGVRVDGGRVMDLVADSRNGAVDVNGVEVADAVAKSRNGAVRADVTPLASGSLVAESRNGAVDVTVPESSAHGYVVQAQSRNGDARVSLSDGQARSDPGEGVASFRSAGLEGRETVTEITANSRNANVHVRGR